MCVDLVFYAEEFHLICSCCLFSVLPLEFTPAFHIEQHRAVLVCNMLTSKWNAVGTQCATLLSMAKTHSFPPSYSAFTITPCFDKCHLCLRGLLTDSNSSPACKSFPAGIFPERTVLGKCHTETLFTSYVTGLCNATF